MNTINTSDLLTDVGTMEKQPDLYFKIWAAEVASGLHPLVLLWAHAQDVLEGDVLCSGHLAVAAFGKIQTIYTVDNTIYRSASRPSYTYFNFVEQPEKFYKTPVDQVFGIILHYKQLKERAMQNYKEWGGSVFLMLDASERVRKSLPENPERNFSKPHKLWRYISVKN